MPIATLSDLKAHLGITDTTGDDELQQVLDAANEVVESIVGPLNAGTYTDTYAVDSDEIVLRRRPVASVVSVTSRYGSALPAEAYALDGESGVLRSLLGGFYGYYVVTYTVGRPLTPAPVRLAALIVADQLWESQRMPGSSRFGARGEPTVPIGFAIPNRAVELLAPYRHLGIA